jgi:hypothetical protein
MTRTGSPAALDDDLEALGESSDEALLHWAMLVSEGRKWWDAPISYSSDTCRAELGVQGLPVPT